MKKLLAILFSFWTCAAQAQIVGTLPFQLQNNTTADATQVMADFNKILGDTNANGAKNGSNNDIMVLNALVTPLTTIQGGSTTYIGSSTSTGSANAQVVTTLSPTGFSLSVGKRATFVAGFTNTGATQLNINGTGLTNVFRSTPSGPVALIGSEIGAGNYIEVVYDGTRFQLYTDTSTPGPGVTTNLASAATTDLGTIPSHNIQITGTVTITSFGSSALTTYPVYLLTFNAALTLTYNATSLILPGSANILTALGDSAVALYLGSGNWQIVSYGRRTGVPVVIKGMTVQTFTSGTSLTYTTPAGVTWIRIRMVGGGGSGANSTTAPGNTGSASTWSGGSLSAGGGGGGNNNSSTANVSSQSGGNIVNLQGGAGGGDNSATNGVGAPGGGSYFAGGGGAGINAGAAGTSGSGGGGAGTGGGGSAGGYVEHVITAPAAGYTYTVGSGGAAVGNSGPGGAGLIIVEEHYGS